MKVKIIEQATDFDMSQIKGGSTICSPYTMTPCAWYRTCGTRPDQTATATVTITEDSYYSSGGSECIGFYGWETPCAIARNF